MNGYLKPFVFVLGMLPLLLVAGCGSNVPTKPIRVTAVDSTEGVKVSWSPPADGSAGEIDKYVVTANPGRISVEVPGRTLEATIKQLDKDIPYTFSVQAKNESGSSEISASTEELIVEDFPEPPLRVTAEAGNGTALVKWYPPSDSSDVVTYSVISRPATRPIRVSSEENQVLFKDLRNGISYEFVVISSNNRGAGKESKPSTGVIPSGVPDSPSNVMVEPGDGVATVSWAPPRSDGGKSITRYIIESTPGRVSARVGGDENSVLIDNLKNGGEYVFTVMAVNELGPGEKSRPSRPVLISDRAGRSGN